jgi:hypothetical protein
MLDTNDIIEFIGSDYSMLLDVIAWIINRCDVDDERVILLLDFIEAEQKILELTNK